MKTNPFDRRLKCPYCTIATWSTDWRGFMLDHDRPDGRVCQKAKKEYATYAKETPNV